MGLMPIEFPDAVKATLWSYDLDRLDLQAHKAQIITQVLNYGTADAVAWLFATYPHEEIVKMVEWPRPGEWNRKSLNYWSIVFGVRPVSSKRFP